MKIADHNRKAWDLYVESGNRWTKPVTPGQVASARRGDWELVLTPTKPIPRHWFPPLAGCRVLCLASGGGQQGPILAAAGAQVTVVDNSPRQLEQDRSVARRESLSIALVRADMRDLGAFRDSVFDLIVHPVSNVFVPDVRPVWREAFRVLRPGGLLLAGFNNPVAYLFDYKKLLEGRLEVRHRIPYSDLSHLSAEERQELHGQGEAIEFGHSLQDQIGGQLEAGFVLTGFYEDRDPENVLCSFIDIYIATRAMRPG